jgi:Uncharacterized ACR, YhhQ family COG1738.
MTFFHLKWTALYIALIPFINWSFTWAPQWQIAEGWSFNPVTMVTGLVLVVRDFAQREIGHRVLLAMLVALGLTLWLTGPELALASGSAFAVSEMVDWALFTFTALPLWGRVLLSSALAAPVDTVVFLYGANFIRPDSLTFANASLSIVGKMVGAVIVAFLIRRRERAHG